MTFFPRQDIVNIIGIILNYSASLEKVGEEMKYSKQREMVLQAVGRLPGHPNAAEVYEEVKKACASISLATVYRNLNTMADHGLIGKVCLPEGADRFDKETHLHDHMICTCCGDVDRSAAGALAADLCRDRGKNRLYARESSAHRLWTLQ